MIVQRGPLELVFEIWTETLVDRVFTQGREEGTQDRSILCGSNSSFHDYWCSLLRRDMKVAYEPYDGNRNVNCGELAKSRGAEEVMHPGSSQMTTFMGHWTCS
jgi:hypothetical protein